ncbi:MAG: hypothetical protein CFH41_01610 [Alphaproteobacteria bacterium MarineAlpha11_Bin1]|nr:MAG: hypothetical protein CFH41_01610 [Alphaproteobacteria bacterium MarineAlpha11_Bin1]
MLSNNDLHPYTPDFEDYDEHVLVHYSKAIAMFRTGATHPLPNLVRASRVFRSHTRRHILRNTIAVISPHQPLYENKFSIADFQ